MKTKMLFLLGLVTVISCSRNEKQDVVMSYINAHNAHDVEGALAHYAESIVFELKDTWTKEGLGEMRSLEEWDAALNSHLKLEVISLKEDWVVGKVVENNDWFRAVGITDLVHDPVVFVVDQGKIKKILAEPSESTAKQIEAVIGATYQWSQQLGDSTIHSLIQNGEFIYSKEAAEKWLDLFKRQHASDSLK